jgi:pimeloyl-ACP methyl ester carboxylesterase
MRVLFIERQAGLARYYRAEPDAFGGATPLVLIHGAGASADTWVRNIPSLAEDRAVFAPDLIGHGLSEDRPHDGKPPQEMQVDHLIELIDAWKLDRVMLLGSSFGALLAALVTLERPEAVEKLVLVGSGSTLHPAADQEAILRGVLANQRPALSAPTLDSIAARNVGSSFDKSDTFSEIQLIQLSALSMPGRARFFEETIEGLIATAGHPKWRVYDRLELLRLPVLIISGANDPRADPAQVKAAGQRLPDCRIEIFDACGHKPFSEHPRRFNTLVREFLSQEA